MGGPRAAASAVAVVAIIVAVAAVAVAVVATIVAGVGVGGPTLRAPTTGGLCGAGGAAGPIAITGTGSLRAPPIPVDAGALCGTEGAAAPLPLRVPADAMTL